MADLTPRQRSKIDIWHQAEAYINHQQREQAENPDSLSRGHYDSAGSRGEFEDNWSET